MSVKLHQLVAVLNGKKTKNLNEITEIHKINQKAPLFNGQSKTYKPQDDLGETLPDETTLVQAGVTDNVDRARKQWVDYFDLVVSVDSGSMTTKADVVINGNKILESMPVLSLIFLEQQMNDVRKFFLELPVLDSNYSWKYDKNRDCFVTDPVQSNRTITKKEPITLAPATDKHPAQAVLNDVSKLVGLYHTTRFSKAIPANTKRDYIDRIDKLIEAIKLAREQANTVEVTQRKETDKIFDYILNG